MVSNIQSWDSTLHTWALVKTEFLTISLCINYDWFSSSSISFIKEYIFNIISEYAGCKNTAFPDLMILEYVSSRQETFCHTFV